MHAEVCPAEQRLPCHAVAYASTCVREITPWHAALLDGDLDYEDGVAAAARCPRIYLDADNRAFRLSPACFGDQDSIVDLPNDFYDEYDGAEESDAAAEGLEAAAQALLPAPAPLPPLPTFEECLPNVTVRGYRDAADARRDGAFVQPYNCSTDASASDSGCRGCCVSAAACGATHAEVLLTSGQTRTTIVGFAAEPGQGGAMQALPDGGYVRVRRGGVDGLLPGEPGYPADRPYCNITAPFGVSYTAENGTSVPLLFMLEDKPFACNTPAGSAYGSASNRRGRCRRVCKRCGGRCGRCKRCRRRRARGL